MTLGYTLTFCFTKPIDKGVELDEVAPLITIPPPTRLEK